MHVHVIMHDLPHLPCYTIAHQHLCINACSSSYECSRDSTKTKTLIINLSIQACETCYSSNPNARHAKTRLNET